MKTLNILLICVVVIVSSVLLFNKKAMSEHAIDVGHIKVGDIVLMTLQKTDTIVLYHKPSQAFLFYGYPSLKTRNEGMKLMQIRTLRNDLILAGKLSDLETELEWKESGYSVKETKKKFK